MFAKSKEEKSGSVQQYVGNTSMLTSLCNAEYVMVLGVHSAMIFLSAYFFMGQVKSLLSLTAVAESQQ